MITMYQKTSKDKKIKTLEEFKPSSWISVENPTEEEMRDLAARYSLEEGLLRDATDPHEVPRLEIEGGNVYIFVRVPYGIDDHVSTVPFLIIIGSDVMFTFSQYPLPFFEKFTQEKIKFSTAQHVRLALQFLLEINAAYHQFLHNISRSIRSISVSIDRIENQNIIQFVTFEHILNDFISALVPMNEGLSALVHGKSLSLHEEDTDLVKDFLLSNNQLIKLCSSHSKMIMNIRSAYSTIMTNNLNRIIKVLTVLTIVLTVPMIIASFYGMNVRLPLAESQHAFWIIVGLAAIVSGFLLGIFFSKRWM